MNPTETLATEPQPGREATPFETPVSMISQSPLSDTITPVGGDTTVQTVLVGAVATAIALSLLVIGVRAAVRYNRSQSQRLVNALSPHEELTILLPPNPDQDALAAGVGVKAIAEYAETDAHIQHSGEIRQQQNRAFKTNIGVNSEKIDTRSEIHAPDAVILLDHNTPRGFVGAKTVEPLAVIDHHRGNGTGTAFTDVRDGYGATSTLVTEYLFEINPELLTDPKNESHPEHDSSDTLHISSSLCTGLVSGIQFDTEQLTRECADADFAACQLLFPGVDQDMLNRIKNPSVSHDLLRVKATAIENVSINRPFGVCDVGEIENENAISQAAEELMKIEGMSSVVVYGRQNGVLSLSGRSTDDRVHMGEALQNALSKIDIGSAGGHSRVGGAQVPLRQLDAFSSDDISCYQGFTDALFAALKGDY